MPNANALLIRNYNSLVIAPRLSEVAMTSDFKRKLRKMRASQNVCLCLKTALPASMTAKRVRNMEREYLRTVRSIAKSQ